MTEQNFKFAKAKGETVIFPHPVDKKNKYLVKLSVPLEERGLKVLMSALNAGFLASPQQDPSLYQEKGLHDDGQTPIYELSIEDLQFQFLTDKEIDPKKGEGIEKVLSKKLVALILAQDEQTYAQAYSDFIKRFEAQKHCSTCQKMGIQSPKLQEWVESL